MASIYDLSWGESSFLAKLKLFFKSNQRQRPGMKSANPGLRSSAYSALSSTYYSIAGTARAQFKQVLWSDWFMLPRLLLFGCTWLPLGIWCYWRMLHLSNQVERILGYEAMSAAQCDVRQSILRRRKKFAETEKCLWAGLHKSADSHTRGLLRVGFADIMIWKGELVDARASIKFAIGHAIDSSNKRQAARIYRQCAELFERIEPGDPRVACWHEVARSLIELAEAADQRTKLF